MTKKVNKNREVQTIFRTRKDRNNPYVTINVKVFYDRRLSLKAKGLMGILLTFPNNWKLIIQNLIKLSKDGRDAHYSAIKELKDLGYIEHVAFRKDGKIDHYEYFVYETPIENPTGETRHIDLDEFEKAENEHSPEYLDFSDLDLLPENPETDEELLPDFPYTGFQDTENQDTENPTLLNNKNTNNLSDTNNEQQLTSKTDFVVVVQNKIEELFGRTLTEKHCKNLIKLAEAEEVDLMDMIQNTYDYFVATEEVCENPFGSIRHAILNGGWIIPTKLEKPKNPEPKKDKYAGLPKAVRMQLEAEEKGQEYQSQSTLSEEELAERQRRVNEKIRLLETLRPEQREKAEMMS